METKQKVENLLKTAKLYKGQGLLNEARKAYQGAFDLIKSSDMIKNKDAILSDIKKKIGKLESDAAYVETAPSTHELPEDVQNLIKNLFSFSEKKDPDTKALTEAVTLAKFGQTERAIDELTTLLDRKSVGVVAAKNILRCYIQIPSYDRALKAYEKWASEEKFLPNELESIRNLLEHQLLKKGIEIQKPLPEVTVLAAKNAMSNGSEEEKPQDMLDIGSVLINFDQGPLKGKPIEFDVNFQTGNTVSLLIESKEKKILDTLNVGFRLRDLQFRSSVAIFRGAGVVSAKLMIHEGPKKGDYLMDIKVQDD